MAEHAFGHERKFEGVAVVTDAYMEAAAKSESSTAE